MDSKNWTVIPNKVGADPGAADATFQWPPAEEDEASALLRVPGDAEEPGQQAAAQRASVVNPPSPDPKEPPQVALQKAQRQRQMVTERARQTGPPAGSRFEFPRLRYRSAALRLRPHLFGLAFALLALVAGAQGAYILRPSWFRTIVPPTGVPQAPFAAATEAVATGREMGLPKEASEGTGTTGDVRGGHLSIRSEPSGARVSIDGRSYGVTPLTLDAVPAGERRIVLKLDGLEVRQTVRIEPGGTASLIAPMGQTIKSTSGWIAIGSKAELDIFENGVLVGSTRSPQVMMPAGLHTLRLVNETLGYERTQKISVEPGKVTRVGLALPKSTIHLNAQPWADVWIDGQSAGETPIGNLPLGIGTHQIVFRHPELGEKTVSAVVKAGAPTRVTVDLRK